MVLGKACVWSKFSYCKEFGVPSGCLLDPNGRHLIFFDECKKLNFKNVKVFTHLFYINHLAEPSGLKNTRLLDLNCAFETWEELINNGWIEVQRYIG